MTKVLRSQTELHRISGHLHYEIEMLIGTAKELHSGKIDPGTILWNSLLESFLVHARNLLDFFYNDKPKKDDSSTSDFFATPTEWKNKLPRKSLLLEEVHKRVNKEVAHLTYTRLSRTPLTKGWKSLDIAQEINNNLVLEFLRLVPAGKLGEKLKDAKNRSMDKS